jgi:hypothetical protein
MRPPALRLALWFFALALLAGPAKAGPNEECFAAADSAQTLRDEGRYSQARDRLAVCSAASCPLVVQRDCSRWIDEIMQTWPTLVVSASDLQGFDLADVLVTVDDAPLAKRLDGTPLLVDPGEHVVRCETEGAPPVEQKIVVRSGEKNRILRVRFSKGGPVPVGFAVRATAKPGASEPPAPAPAMARTLRWVFGGAAVAAFGTAMYFGFTGLSRYDEMKSGCAATLPGNCSSSDVSYTQTHFLVSDISVGIGLASAAAAAYFFLTSVPRTPLARSEGTRVHALMGAARGGGVVGLGGSF